MNCFMTCVSAWTVNSAGSVLICSLSSEDEGGRFMAAPHLVSELFDGMLQCQDVAE